MCKKVCMNTPIDMACVPAVLVVVSVAVIAAQKSRVAKRTLGAELD